MLQDFIQFIVDQVGSLGYPGIFLMMTLESSFIPFPSEVAMIPAGVLSAQGSMNFFWALFAGTLGAWAGATINYVLGFYLGGPIIKKLIHKYGKYIFLSEKHYEQSEVFFQKHGGITMFLGRFIPAVRQLISLPAGVFRMNFIIFSIYTVLGAGIWNLILLSLGYFYGNNMELISQYTTEILLGFFGILLSVGIISYLLKKRK